MLLALFTLAGLGYSLLLGGDTRFPDERDYLAVAASLVHEGIYSYDGLVPNAMRPPGYPVLIAPAAAAAAALAPGTRPVGPTPAAVARPAGALPAPTAAGSIAGPRETALTVHAVRTLQFLALGLSALALGSLAGGFAGRASPSPGTLGAATLVGLAGYPVLVYTAGTLFPQTAVLGLATLALWLLERARPSAGAALLVGLACGAAVEVSPTALTLVPVALLHAWLSPRWTSRRVVVVALAAALLPGAWLARNLVTLDEPILFSRNLAYNLDNAVLELDPLDGAAAERAPDDALGYGAERLSQFLGSPRAYLERLVGHFAWRNDLHVTEETSTMRDAVMLVTYATLLALVALRLALVRREPLSRAERSVLLLYAMTAAFHALVFVRIRYRLPFDFLLFLPALNAVLLGIDAMRSRHPRSRAPTTTVP